jgi:hypothetical protein
MPTVVGNFDTRPPRSKNQILVGTELDFIVVDQDGGQGSVPMVSG